MQTTTEPIRSSAAGEQIVTVCLSTETYGIPIHLVESIVRWEPLTRLPRLPAFLAGILSLRGQAIPVVDLRLRLELPATECGPEQRIVIVSLDGMQIGLIVDGVREVLWVEATRIEANVPMITGASESDYLRGVANLPQGFVILLALDRLLSTGERDALATLS